MTHRDNRQAHTPSVLGNMPLCRTECSPTRLSTITHITVRDSDSLDDEALMSVVRRCTMLKRLDIVNTNISDALIIALSHNCTLIKELDITNCVSITDASIVALAQRCTSIRTLTMDKCALISDASLLALSERCHALENLSVIYCTLITDAGVCAVATLPRLMQFSARVCVLLTDVSGKALLLSPAVVHANLSDCPQMSSELKDEVFRPRDVYLPNSWD